MVRGALTGVAVFLIVGVTEAATGGPVSNYTVEVLGRGNAAQAYPGAACISERGDVAGFLRYEHPTRFRAVVWSNDDPVELPTPEGNSFALSINDRGDVVGLTQDTDPSGSFSTHAVL